MVGLSVIIPVHNGSETLGALLDSLENSSFTDFEVICVDDCSSDDSSRIAGEAGAGVIKLESRSGPAAARNRGAAAASGNILLFLDSDVEVDHRMIEEIARTFRIHPEIAAAVGVYSKEPASKGFWPAYKAVQSYYFRECFKDEHITWFWGSMGAVRKEIFESIGGFNESYRNPGLEDVELGRRLAEKGKILLARNAVVSHHFASTFKKNFMDHFSRALQYADIFFNDKKFDNYLSTPFHALSKMSGAGFVTTLFFSIILLPFFETIAQLLFSLSIFLFVSYNITILPFFLFTWKKYTLSLAAGAYLADLAMAEALGIAAAVGTIKNIARMREKAAGPIAPAT